MLPVLLTDRLRLRPFTADDLEAAVRGDDALSAQFGAPVVAGWMEYPESLPYFIPTLRADPGAAVWGMYGALLHAEGDALVGGVGFKGRPKADGTVEIGYGIAPAYRGRGLATEAAAALVAFAFAHAEVHAVRAHTLPEVNASNRLLTRLGFVPTGTVMEQPEDGPVWRWHLPRP